MKRKHDSSHCYCITEFIDEQDKKIDVLGKAPDNDFWVNAVTSANFTSIAPLWRRQVLFEIGPWDEELVCRQDWVYKSRILMQFGYGTFVPQILCRAKLHYSGRISKHGTEDFIVGTMIAIGKVAKNLSSYNSVANEAKNCLAKEMLAVFKGFIRIKNYIQAKEALNEATSFSNGSLLNRLRIINALWAILKPPL